MRLRGAGAWLQAQLSKAGLGKKRITLARSDTQMYGTIHLPPRLAPRHHDVAQPPRLP
jgi:hypothetical protein